MPHNSNKHWFEELQPGLNLTPLLDVVFNLIFFFILATTIKESQAFLNVTLPYSEQAQVVEQTPPSTLEIVVSETNEIFIQDKLVDIKSLPDELRKINQSRKIDNVIIKGDAKAYHQTIIQVLDACASAHLYKVSVEVQQKKNE